MEHARRMRRARLSDDGGICLTPALGLLPRPGDALESSWFITDLAPYLSFDAGNIDLNHQAGGKSE